MRPEFVPGTSAGMREVFRQCRLFAPLKDAILLLGEPGTGKTLLANCIHEWSGRSGQFVSVSTGELGDSLLESTLFGHTRGAFTDAKTTTLGHVEAAHEGTFFLDELGEGSDRLQVALLRLLERCQVRRVGDHRSRELDVRFIMATNADLEALASLQEFRPDLLARFGFAVFTIPPLRERRADIRELAVSFFRTEARGLPRPPAGIADGIFEVFESYDWPGNARELKAACRFALIQAQGAQVDVQHVPRDVLIRKKASSATRMSREPLLLANIERVLAAVEGNMSEAARILGMSRQHLYTLLKRLRPSDSNAA